MVTPGTSVLVRFRTLVRIVTRHVGRHVLVAAARVVSFGTRTRAPGCTL